MINYNKATNALSDAKESMYEIASQHAHKGEKGQQIECYKKADKIQRILNEVMKMQGAEEYTVAHDYSEIFNEAL